MIKKSTKNSNGKNALELMKQMSSDFGTFDNGNKLDWSAKAKILTEILPYSEKHSGDIFVISINGKAIDNPKIMKNFAQDVAILKHMGVNPIVIHGVGKQIEKMLKKMDIKPTFIDDKMVIDKNTIEIFEMIASGSISKNIAMEINKSGCKAIGISGKDGGLIKAEKVKKVETHEKGSNVDKIIDLGFVGQPTAINIEILGDLDEPNFIPVISPIGVGENDTTYAIDPDVIACLISSILAANKMIILGDTGNFPIENKKLTEIDELESLGKLVEDEKIKGPLATKVSVCINAIENGVETVQLLDGSVPHVLLKDIFK